MNKKKLKKILVPLILLILLAGLIIGYTFMKEANDEKAMQDSETTEEETAKITVLDKSTLTVTKLDIGEGNLNFSYVNDVWQWDGDDKYPLDKTIMSEMGNQAALVEAMAQVKDAGELSEYGLDKPSFTVKAEFSDKSAVTYLFGDVNDFNGYQYFKTSISDEIYMLSQDVSGKFDTDIEALYGKESCAITEDSVQATNVASILIETPEKTNEITDEDGIKELFTPFYAMNLSDWEDYYADETEMEKMYGIGENSAKITLTYTKMESSTDENGANITVKVPYKYTVLIGNLYETDETDDDGKPVMGYFYTKEGSTVVYSVAAEKVDAVMEYLDYDPAHTTEAE